MRRESISADSSALLRGASFASREKVASVPQRSFSPERAPKISCRLLCKSCFFCRRALRSAAIPYLLGSAQYHASPVPNRESPWGWWMGRCGWRGRGVARGERCRRRREGGWSQARRHQEAARMCCLLRAHPKNGQHGPPFSRLAPPPRPPPRDDPPAPRGARPPARGPPLTAGTHASRDTKRTALHAAQPSQKAAETAAMKYNVSVRHGRGSIRHRHPGHSAGCSLFLAHNRSRLKTLEAAAAAAGCQRNIFAAAPGTLSCLSASPVV